MRNKYSLLSRDTNLIAFVGDIYHLLGAITYAYRISKSEKVNGVIYVGKNWLRNDPIKEQVFEIENVNIRIVKNYSYFKILPSKYFIILKHFIFRGYDKSIHIVNVRNASLNLIFFTLSMFNSLIKCVVIEEGISTYYNEKGYVFALKSKIKRILIKMMLYKSEDFTFFTKKGKYNLIPNTDVIANYREFLAKYSNSIYNSVGETLNKYRNKDLTGSAFIASYPILNHHAEYMGFLDKLIKILKKENIKVYIKPHQCDILDQYDIYGVDVLPHDLPIESLLDFFKPDYLFGFLSTALVNANLLYNTYSIDLSNILLNEFNVSLTPHKDYINKLFENQVKVLNSFEELNSLVQKEK